MACKAMARDIALYYVQAIQISTNEKRKLIPLIYYNNQINHLTNVT